jgi:acetolactate synthase-1/2/3 large subunit
VATSLHLIFLPSPALSTAEALAWAGRISAVTGAALLCEGAFARVERGCGMPSLQRLPYFPQEAQKELSRYSLLVTVDAKLPVANFAYR